MPSGYWNFFLFVSAPASAGKGVMIYLHNHVFIHSAPSKGVNIANLRDHYWAQRFLVAGRGKQYLHKPAG
jgi:cell wall-associated NlpC family hydrolase